jgi:hypothetical protein
MGFLRHVPGRARCAPPPPRAAPTHRGRCSPDRVDRRGNRRVASARPARGGLAVTERQARICVLGSVNMDLVSHAPHLPVPGETLLGGPFRTLPGGKGREPGGRRRAPGRRRDDGRRDRP